MGIGKKTFWVLIGTWFWGVPIFALHTAYIDFDHPPGWQCELSQGVWICQSENKAERKESLILSIATVAGPWDTIENYEDYLKRPREFHDEKGGSFESKVTYVRRRNINGLLWVDSLQMHSELPHFWARYLATVHNKLAILITYVVSEDHYKTFAPQFEKMVSSLRTNEEKNLNVASKQFDGPLPGSTKLGPSGALQALIAERLKDAPGAPLPSTDGNSPEAAPKPASGSWAWLLVIPALIGLIIWRRKRLKAARSTQTVTYLQK